MDYNLDLCYRSLRAVMGLAELKNIERILILWKENYLTLWCGCRVQEKDRPI